MLGIKLIVTAHHDVLSWICATNALARSTLPINGWISNVTTAIPITMCPTKVDEGINTHYCINTATDSGNTFLLPVLHIKVGFGARTTFVNGLLDNGIVGS